MKTNGKNGKMAGFRAAAVLLAVLGTTGVMASQPGSGARFAEEAVALDEVVLVSKMNLDPDPSGTPEGPQGALLDSGGGGKGGGLLGGVLGSLLGLGLLGVI